MAGCGELPAEPEGRTVGLGTGRGRPGKGTSREGAAAGTCRGILQGERGHRGCRRQVPTDPGPSRILQEEVQLRGHADGG